MFLVRSAFWLTVAFLVIRPGMSIDTDALQQQAVATGQKLVIEQIIRSQCASVECATGQAVVAMATMQTKSIPSVVSPMQSSSIVAPTPRPRPDWLG